MKITKFKHASILVEEGDARLLVDPSGMAKGWQNLTSLSAVLVTHEHFDHLDPDGLAALVKANPGVHVYTGETTAPVLERAGITHTVMHNGDRVEVAGINIEAMGGEHAPIHSSFNKMGNVAFLIAGRLLHPGDSFVKPSRPIEILATPTSGPWTKTGDAIDYLLAVKPKAAFPIHEALDSMPEMTYDRLKQVADQNGIKWMVITEGESYEFA